MWLRVSANGTTQWLSKSTWYENYLNEKGRPGGLLELGSDVEGTNEKGKLGGGCCVRTLAGGGPQSNVAGPGDGVLSPSGFFNDQADLAWCFALRLPPLVFNGEGEVVGEKVIGGGGGGVTGVALVELKRLVSSFWGVLNSILVLVIVEAFALRSGLSRTLNRTFFSLYADLSAFKVVAAAAAMEDVMLTAFPLLPDLSGNRVSLAGEDLGLWKDLRSSLDMRDDSLLISSICRAIAMSMLRYVRFIVSKVGALGVAVRTWAKVDPRSLDLLEAYLSRPFPVQFPLCGLQVALQLLYPVTNALQDMRRYQLTYYTNTYSHLFPQPCLLLYVFRTEVPCLKHPGEVGVIEGFVKPCHLFLPRACCPSAR